MGKGKSPQGRLAQLEAAFKTITVADLGESILVPMQFNRFIRIMQHENRILADTRRVTMTAQQANIDRTGFMGRVLRPGVNDDGTNKVLTRAEYSAPQFLTNKLIANELQGIVSIYDRTIRRNIERQKLANTLTDMFAAAVGRDLEEYFILADTTNTADPILKKTDGWAKRSANKLYGVANTAGDPGADVARDFDPTSTDPALGFPINMFQKMLVTLPKQYLQDPAEWRFYCGWSVMDAYREQLSKRTGVMPDQIITEGAVPNYKGIPVEYNPFLERAATPAAGGLGRICMLQHPNNMAWGVFHEVTLEPARHAEERMTNYVVTVEVDCDYEDENASVVAFIDRFKP